MSSFANFELSLALSALVILLPISLLPRRTSQLTYRAVFGIVPIILAAFVVTDLTHVTDGKWYVAAIGIFLYLVVPQGIKREIQIQQGLSQATSTKE